MNEDQFYTALKELKEQFPALSKMDEYRLMYSKAIELGPDKPLDSCEHCGLKAGNDSEFKWAGFHWLCRGCFHEFMENLLSTDNEVMH